MSSIRLASYPCSDRSPGQGIDYKSLVSFSFRCIPIISILELQMEKVVRIVSKDGVRSDAAFWSNSLRVNQRIESKNLRT